MKKYSKYRDLLDNIKMKVSRAEMGVTNLYQVMRETLGKADEEELAMKAELDAANARIKSLVTLQADTKKQILFDAAAYLGRVMGEHPYCDHVQVIRSYVDIDTRTNKLKSDVS